MEDNGSTMKTIKTLLLGVCAAALSSQALAAPQVYTATIDRDGKLIHQDVTWIKGVTLTNQKNYFATYEISFTDAQFKRAPAFCSVSAIDTSDFDRLLYGDVKLSGAATTEKVSVLALMPGKSGPSGDSSLSFQLMCIR